MKDLHPDKFSGRYRDAVVTSGLHADPVQVRARCRKCGYHLDLNRTTRVRAEVFASHRYTFGSGWGLQEFGTSWWGGDGEAQYYADRQDSGGCPFCGTNNFI